MDLKNHPGYWLRDDAAQAFNAYEDAYGIRIVNDAGRSVADQQKLIDRWNEGGSANRPPFLYKPADPPETSPHVADGGVAVDIEDYRIFLEHCQEFGFQWYGPGDPVHFNFTGWDGNSPSIPSESEKGNPFGIAFCAGLQKIANLYGAGTEIDQIWGPKSASGFAEFLRQNWGYEGNDVLGPVMWAAIARWLRARWGYIGNDVPGPVMRGCLQAAETANFREL